MQTERNKPEFKPDPNKFDLITHHWNAQGKLLRTNLYVMYINNGNQYFERPVNSGNLWHGDNTPAGRVEKEFNAKGIVTKKTFDHEAPHKAFTPKLEGDDSLHYQLEQERTKSADLERELMAIKKERDRENVYERGETAPAQPAAKAPETPQLKKG